MGTKYDKYGALHVNAAGRLVDRNGTAVVLRGFSTHGLSWYPQYVNRDFFAFMSEKWNADVIRLAMYTDEKDGYCVGDDANKARLLEVIDRGVKAATEVGLYVVIDWHILHDNNPLMHKDEALAFFDLIAKKYHAYGNVFYEICNEPNGDCTWKDIKEYAQAVIPVIRKHDKYAVILCGTPHWSQNIEDAVADPITIDDNLMYVFHFYADTHRKEFRDRFEAVAGKGLPLFISEFGCCDASGNYSNNFEESSGWLSLADKYDVSRIMWNISNRDETSASFVPGCTKISGFEDEDLNEGCRWFVGILAGDPAKRD
ncbi:MAG: glycoside hydrolase family 5 protein [Lachnospiraceae bacterium]|nr:glycoside hydrolase family 5 protein [Lachnospiraceae bacterium]